MKQKESTRLQWFLRWPVLVILGFWLACFPGSWRDEGTKVAGDGVGYYCYVRALVINGDFRLHPNDEVLTEAPGGSRLLQKIYVDAAKAHEDQRIYSQYGVGLSLFWLPIELATHAGMLLLRALGLTQIPADGFTWPYRYATGLMTALGGLAGLLMAFSISEELVGSESALIAMLAGFFGTPLFHYTFYESSMSEVPTFFAVTAVFWLWWRTKPTSTAWHWLLWGLAIGLATMMRYQNGVLFLIPTYEYGASVWNSYGSRGLSFGRILRRNTKNLFAALIGLLSICVVQVIVWKTSYGHFTPPPYTTGIESWTKWQPGAVLWSARKGLFSTHPLWLLGTLGIVLLLQRTRHFAIGLILFFLFVLWLNQLPYDFWGGSGYGSRRFVAASVTVLIGLSSVFHLMHRVVNRYSRMVAAVVFLPFVLLSLKERSALMNNSFIAEHGEISMQRLRILVHGGYTTIGWPFSFPESFIWARRWRVSPNRFDDAASFFVDNATDLDSEDLGGRYRIILGNEKVRNLLVDSSCFVKDVGIKCGPMGVRLMLNFCRLPHVARMRMKISNQTGGPTSVSIRLNENHTSDASLHSGANEVECDSSHSDLQLGSNLLQVTTSRPTMIKWIEIYRGK